MEQILYQTLEDLKISFEKIEHDAFPTCEASGNFYAENNMGVDCKNIFMRNKKGKKHYIVSLLKEKEIDIPTLAEFLGEHRKMGFASDERLEKFLGLKPGSVTPFSLLHPESTEVTAIIDSEIFQHEFVHFHPLRNTATLKISSTDFRKFLHATGREFLEFSF